MKNEPPNDDKQWLSEFRYRYVYIKEVSIVLL